MNTNQVRQAVSTTRYVTAVDVLHRMGLPVTKHNAVTVRTHLAALVSEGAVDMMGNGYMLHTHTLTVEDSRTWDASMAEAPTREALVMGCTSCDYYRNTTDSEYAAWQAA